MKYFKNYKWLIIGLLMVLLWAGICLAQQSSDGNSLNSVTPSIAGTVWSGTEPDGDFYEFHFLKNGQLKYRTNTSRKKIVTFQDKEDKWAQNGDIVIFVTSNYATRQAKITGKNMKGTAWNFAGKRWKWSVNKK